MPKSFSPSCERNKHPILEQLQVYFESSQSVLEIGSGTGQHAVFFAENLPQLTWHTSDMPSNHSDINEWLSETSLDNLNSPLALTIGQDPWPSVKIDSVFTANTTHIMQPSEAEAMMKLVAEHLPVGGIFCQYGPMKISGDFTSDSNKEFNNSLKQRGFGGIRDVEQLVNWAENLQLIEMIPMPANNFLLVWKKSETSAIR